MILDCKIDSLKPMLVLCLYWTSVFTSGLVLIAHPFASFCAAASPPVDGAKLLLEGFGPALGTGLLSLAYIGCQVTKVIYHTKSGMASFI